MISTTFVLVHGAFRGGWAWEPLTQALSDADCSCLAPTLTGCEPSSTRVGTHVRLHEWVDDVSAEIEQACRKSDRVVVVAHSQAGLPVRAALEQWWPSVAHVVYLDAAVPRNGERGVDLNPPGVPSPPDDIDPTLWIPARPVGPDQGFSDPLIAAFVNERLVPTPVGPSLDPVSLTCAEAEQVASTYVFFSATPVTYPCQLTKQRLDGAGSPYIVIESAHDAPLTSTQKIADLLLSLR